MPVGRMWQFVFAGNRGRKTSLSTFRHFRAGYYEIAMRWRTKMCSIDRGLFNVIIFHACIRRSNVTAWRYKSWTFLMKLNYCPSIPTQYWLVLLLCRRSMFSNTNSPTCYTRHRVTPGFLKCLLQDMPAKFVLKSIPIATSWRCGRASDRTCDQEVVGSSLGRARGIKTLGKFLTPMCLCHQAV